RGRFLFRSPWIGPHLIDLDCRITSVSASAAVTYSLFAFTAAAADRVTSCDVPEPDSLGISWTAPCGEGRWLLGPLSGCRMGARPIAIRRDKICVTIGSKTRMTGLRFGQGTRGKTNE